MAGVPDWLVPDESNLDDVEPFFNKTGAIYGFGITCLVISTVCALLRLHVRFFITRCPGWDDYLIVLIVLLSWVTNVGSLFLINVGMGKHFISLGAEGMARFIKMFWWCNACYNMSMTAVKLSILLQYLRLLDDHSDSLDSHGRPRRPAPFLRIAILALVAVSAVWGFIFSFLAWVPSVPVSAYWNHADTNATRFAYGSYDESAMVTTYVAHAACNMAIDMAILVLPLLSRSMWATAGRQRQSRIAMLCLYGLGVLYVVCSVVRFVSVVVHKASTSPTFDPSWYAATPIVLSVLEVDIATTMASLPVFWPYLRLRGRGGVLDRIWVTHEIAVEVTPAEGEEEEGRQQHLGTAGATNERLHQLAREQTYKPWTTDTKGAGAGEGVEKEHQQQQQQTQRLGYGASVVMMRELGRTGTGGSEGEGEGLDLGLPFDGRRGRCSRSQSPMPIFSRGSKEGLLTR